MGDIYEPGTIGNRSYLRGIQGLAGIWDHNRPERLSSNTALFSFVNDATPAFDGSRDEKRSMEIDNTDASSDEFIGSQWEEVVALAS